MPGRSSVARGFGAYAFLGRVGVRGFGFCRDWGVLSVANQSRLWRRFLPWYSP